MFERDTTGRMYRGKALAEQDLKRNHSKEVGAGLVFTDLAIACLPMRRLNVRNNGVACIVEFLGTGINKGESICKTEEPT